MTNDSSTGSVDRTTAASPPVLVPGARTALYGVVAAGGCLALLSGIRNYQQFAADGGGNQLVHLLAVLAILSVGFTLLVVALAATVAMGIDHATSQ